MPGEDEKSQTMRPDALRDQVLRIPATTSPNLVAYVGNLATLLSQKSPEEAAPLYESVWTGVVEQPAKLSVYTMLVGAVNVKQPAWAAGLVAVVASKIEEAMAASAWRTAKLGVRFAVDLTNVGVVAADAALGLLETLVGATRELGPPNLERSDCFVGLAVAALPWGAPGLAAGAPARFNAFLEAVRAYMDGEARASAASMAGSRSARRYFKRQSAAPFEQASELESLWRQIQTWVSEAAVSQDASVELPATVVGRPYAAAAGEFVGAQAHELPPVRLPLEIPGDTVYAFSAIRLWLLDASFVADRVAPARLPGLNDVNRFVLADMTSDMVTLYAHNVEVCAGLLAELAQTSCGLDAELVAQREWELFETVLETVLVEMLRLPAPRHRLLYYSTLVAHLVRHAMKHQLAVIPKTLGKLFRLIWVWLAADGPQWDVECVRRFCEFFAHYASNFEYRWKWDEWVPALERSDARDTQLVVVREIAELCCRLACADDVRRVLGAQAAASPHLALDAYGSFAEPNWASAELSNGDQELATRVAALREANLGLVYNERLRKVPAEAYDAYDQAFDAVQAHLSQRQDAAEVAASGLLPAAVLVTMIDAGKASYSQLLTYVEKIGPKVKPLLADSAPKQYVLARVHDALRNNQELFEIAIDKLVNYRLVDLPSLVAWMCNVSSGPLALSFDRLYLWNVLRVNINKLVWRKQFLKRQFEAAQKKAAERQAAASAGAGVADMETDAAGADPELAQLVEAAGKAEAQYDRLSQDLKNTFLALFEGLAQLLHSRATTAGVYLDVDPFWCWVAGFTVEFARCFAAEVRALRVTLGVLTFGAQKHAAVLALWADMDQYLGCKMA